MQDKVLVNNWFTKANLALQECEKAIAADILTAAQNRLYYAIFYAVNALASKNGFATSKHTQLLGWFNKNYIYTKILDEDTAEIYKKSFEYRQKCDYLFDFKPSKDKLINDLMEAQKFLNAIKRELSD